MAQWAQQYGPLYKVHFLDECVLVCTDPESNARITRRTGDCVVGRAVVCVWRGGSGRGEWEVGSGRVNLLYPTLSARITRRTGRQAGAPPKMECQ